MVFWREFERQVAAVAIVTATLYRSPQGQAKSFQSQLLVDVIKLLDFNKIKKLVKNAKAKAIVMQNYAPKYLLQFNWPTFCCFTSGIDFLPEKFYNIYRPPSLWPDWAIYWTLGIYSNPLAIINLPKSPTFLGNFCKGVKFFNFSSKIILGQLF